MAQSQVSAGALLEAIATLDRVLATDPKHKLAKLLRASLLCRVDDRSGAAVASGPFGTAGTWTITSAWRARGEAIANDFEPIEVTDDL